jgi:hypothetical protein
MMEGRNDGRKEKMRRKRADFLLTVSNICPTLTKG